MTTTEQCQQYRELDAKAQQLHEDVATGAQALLKATASGLDAVQAARALTTVAGLLMEAIERERDDMLRELRECAADNADHERLWTVRNLIARLERGRK